MGKRHRDETKEERKERKRAKKEAKMQKGANNENDQTPSNNNVHQQASLSPIIQPTGAVSPSTPTTKSPFQEKRLKMMVSLYPVALSNVLSHVREALRRSLLLKFSDGVGGVLLGFENVTFSEKKRLGMILNEFPQVHYTVELDALIFCPEEIGSKVRELIVLPVLCETRMHVMDKVLTNVCLLSSYGTVDGCCE